MPPFLFWGRRVHHNSIFCDVRGEHDPAYECLVTNLFGSPVCQIQNPAPSCDIDETGFVREVTGISYPLLTNTYHECRGSVSNAATGIQYSVAIAFIR
jgi:hypothetical protein